MKIAITVSLIIFLSAKATANTIHFSPEIKTGPYIGAGLSGYGLQFGLRDVWGLESLYVSYTDTNAEFLYVDQDQISTYRIGGQFLLLDSPKMSLQVEVGLAKYRGERDYIISDKRYLYQEGVSTSASWVIELNDYMAWRVGVDINYLDSSSTFLESSFAPALSTGLIFSF
ncbi:hypothetical protein MACH09_30500 [Vibrio sp. MACH09]|nr:hypothetical protein MACH09_30500 [Vibrio sp. MACH09]